MAGLTWCSSLWSSGTDSIFQQTRGYGLDPLCQKTRDLIRSLCAAPDADVHFLVGGTQTNLLVIESMLKPYEAVISAHTGHVNVHETGAIDLAEEGAVFGSADVKRVGEGRVVRQGQVPAGQGGPQPGGGGGPRFSRLLNVLLRKIVQHPEAHLLGPSSRAWNWTPSKRPLASIAPRRFMCQRKSGRGLAKTRASPKRAPFLVPPM